ncbi:hypothetical protein J113_16840 [Mycobacterium tuberculosis CAS/NITR204]|uniref:Uncharacterized protein n=1 Tax=Mycobacterium tuberculosis CAS/NITR204 TaxID=1310114 RepID=R4MG18_MYCTX|nr:hypothetical protein J113_16840 [Mycobacterium tuberculosis CAS/NITR204]
MRDHLGLVPGEVEVVADGAGLGVATLAGDSLGERHGLPVIPAGSAARCRPALAPCSWTRASRSHQVQRGHDHHEDTFQALRGRTLGLAGHAAFELHAGDRVELLAHTFPATRFLGAGAAMSLLPELAPAEIAGGAV